MCDILIISRFIFEMVNDFEMYIMYCIALMRIGT
jgi:hypothetical protein